MASVVKVRGVGKVIRRLRLAGKFTAKRFERGLKKGGLALQRESQLVVPVDTGLLRSTIATTAEGTGFDTVVKVAYEGTNYGIFVHEDLEAQHAPGKIAKYLEKPAKTKTREILRAIQQEAGK